MMQSSWAKKIVWLDGNWRRDSWKKGEKETSLPVKFFSLEEHIGFPVVFVFITNVFHGVCDEDFSVQFGGC